MPPFTEDEKQALIRLITRDIQKLINDDCLYKHIQIGPRTDPYVCRPMLTFKPEYPKKLVDREVKLGPEDV